jgi:hypothetical protein
MNCFMNLIGCEGLKEVAGAGAEAEEAVVGSSDDDEDDEDDEDEEGVM